MTYTPLASYSDMSNTPLNDIIRGWVATSGSSQVQTDVMIPASRHIESMCDRHLVPFTGLSESQRLQNIDIDGSYGYPGFPLDQTATLGLSRAQSLGADDLVREFWVDEAPPVWSELWTGSITSVTVYNNLNSSIAVNMNTLQYEADTGHVRVGLGTFAPQGSRAVVVYSGGYSTIPPELRLACQLEACLVALLFLEPGARPDVDTAELEKKIKQLIEPFRRRSDT